MSSSDVLKTDTSSQNDRLPEAGAGLVGHIFLPLIFASVFAFGMSCFLTFEYKDRTEWAAKTSNFSAYELKSEFKSTTGSVPAVAPIPSSVPEATPIHAKTPVSGKKQLTEKK